jgi:hypothetical chaperone protein
MPLLGYHALIGDRRLPVPRHLYHDLATWHRIPSLYTPANLSYLRSILRAVDEPQLIQRLINVLDERKGHRLAAEVEAAKIALSEQREVRLDLPLRPAADTVITRNDLDWAVREDVKQILLAIDRCCQEAGIEEDEVQSVFLTGGSTAIPEIRRQILAKLPNARPVSGDIFGSVGLGLAIDAERRFGRGHADLVATGS